MAGASVVRAYATKTVSVSSTALLITDAGFSWAATDVSTADRALITSFTNGISVAWSGATPTATLGHAIAANGTLEVVGQENVKHLQFIRLTSDATVSVTLSKF